MSTTAASAPERPVPLINECCAPLLREPITASQADSLARVLKALADPVRLQIVSAVAARENSEACVCELTEHLGLSQPNISYHLKLLVDAGIFTRDKRGVWMYYRLQPAALNAVSAVLAPGIAREAVGQPDANLSGRRHVSARSCPASASAVRR